MRKGVLFVGNTGVGKSEICNYLLKKQKFESKENPTSVTRELSREITTIKGNEAIIYNIPGLLEDDEEKVEQNKRIIQQAFESKEEVYVFYVLTVEGGRLRTPDIDAYKALTQAYDIKQKSFAFIVNKYSGSEAIKGAIVARIHQILAKQSVFFIPDNKNKEFKDRAEIGNNILILAFEELEPNQTTKLKELKLAKDEIKELHDEMKKKQKEFDKKLEDQKENMNFVFQQTKKDYDAQILTLNQKAEIYRKQQLDLTETLKSLTEVKNYHGGNVHGQPWRFWVYPKDSSLPNTRWDAYNATDLCDNFKYIGPRLEVIHEYECLGHSTLYHGARHSNYEIYVYPSDHPWVRNNCWDTDSVSKICNNATYSRLVGGAKAFRCHGHKGPNTGYN